MRLGKSGPPFGVLNLINKRKKIKNELMEAHGQFIIIIV